MRPGRRALSFHLERHEPAREAALLFLKQLCPPNEIWLRQVNKECEPGFQRIVLRRKVGAVERITHLKTQSIARAEPAGTNAYRFSLLQNFVPNPRGRLRGEEDFNA